MAAKVHKSLRLDNDLVERVNGLREDGETLTNAMARVMAVGCDALERGTHENTVEHGCSTDVAQPEHDENTALLIETLRAENARLTAEHEADKAAIADKDEQIARALDKAHELAEQAHVLVGMAQRTEALPAPDEPAATDDAPAEPEPKPAPAKISFWEWWKNYR